MSYPNSNTGALRKMQSKSFFRVASWGLAAIITVMWAAWALQFFSSHQAKKPELAPVRASIPIRQARLPVEAESGEGIAGVALGTPSAVAAGLSLPLLMQRHGNFADALREALAVWGPNDRDVQSAIMDVTAMCQELPEISAFRDPDSGLMPGHEDSSKIWAIDKLQGWCEGFDGPELMKQVDLSFPKAMEATASPDPRYQRAHLQSEITFEAMYAGRVMVDRGQLPVRQIWGSEPPLRKEELIAEWMLAAALASCQRQFGCGPNSPVTLSYCAQSGCAPGRSYRQVLQDSVPPRNYTDILSIARWISNRPDRRH